MDRDLPKMGEKWRHFENKNSKIITIATHTETKERFVIYQALYDNMQIFATPLKIFMSEVDHDKHPNAEQKFRFEKIN